MKIYLAGPSHEIARIVKLREQITAAGHEVTSRWIDIIQTEHVDGKTDADVPAARLAECAEINIADLVEADFVVYVTPWNNNKSEGAAFELGYAMSRGRERIVVLTQVQNRVDKYGQRDSVTPHETLFALLVPRFAELSNLLAYLDGWEKSRKYHLEALAPTEHEW